MARRGYFKIYRELFDPDATPWFNALAPEKQIAIIRCLNRARYRPGTLADGRRLEPGQFVYGREEFAAECGIGVQKLRTALSIAKKAEFLTIEATKAGSIITIVNWDTYQGSEESANQGANQQPTNSQPTANQQPTTSEEGKKERREEGREGARAEDWQCEKCRSVLPVDAKAGHVCQPTITAGLEPTIGNEIPRAIGQKLGRVIRWAKHAHREPDLRAQVARQVEEHGAAVVVEAYAAALRASGGSYMADRSLYVSDQFARLAPDLAKRAQRSKLEQARQTVERKEQQAQRAALASNEAQDQARAKEAAEHVAGLLEQGPAWLVPLPFQPSRTEPVVDVGPDWVAVHRDGGRVVLDWRSLARFNAPEFWKASKF